MSKKHVGRKRLHFRRLLISTLISFFLSLMDFSGRRFFFVIFFVTARCPSKCVFCFDWKRQGIAKKKEELSLDEIKKLSKSFKSAIITLTGGEPLARTDLAEIATLFYKHSGVRFLTIPTGAQYPERIIDFIEKVMQDCPKLTLVIKISLDQLGAEHDRLRVTPGNFEKAKLAAENIKQLQKKYKRLKLKVNTVVSKENLASIDKLSEYVFNEISPDHHSLTNLHGVPRVEGLFVKRTEYYSAKDRQKRLYKNSRVFLSRIYSAFQKVAQSEIDSHYANNFWKNKCKAGTKLVVIRENGDILPCEIKTKVSGNLRNNDYSLPKTLANSSFCLNANVNKCSCDWECAANVAPLYTKKGITQIFVNAFTAGQKVSRPDRAKTAAVQSDNS